jgi:hypothetical protein
VEQLMQWRQVILLYAVAGLLAMDYFRTGMSVDEPVADGKPARPRVVRLDRATISEVAIEHGNRRVVARRDGDGWRVEEPAGVEIPSDLVRAFVAAVLDADEIERLGHDQTRAAFGLDEAATRVEIRPSGGPPETLWLGNANPSGTAVYARRLGDDDVILVGRTLRLYEELIFQALPQAEVPADTPEGPVGAREPLTSPGRPV